MKDVTNRIQGLFPLILLLLWLLPACTPIFYTKSQSEPPVSQCGGLLSYYETLRMMPGEEQGQELALLRVSLNYAETPCNQLRLAMLLGMPEFRFDNDIEAKQLLKVFLNSEGTPAIHDQQIAWLLMDEIQWRKQRQSKRQILIKQLEEEHATSTDLLVQLKTAQSKLNQLKNIDKNINDREQEISTPSTDKIPHESK